MELIIILIGLSSAVYLLAGRNRFDFRPVFVGYPWPMNPEEKIELSGGRMAFLGGLISGIGKALGGVVGLAGKVASVVPGFGGVIGQAAETIHGLVWPKQHTEMYGTTTNASGQMVPAVSTTPVATSSGLFGMSPTTLLLIGGGVLLILYMRKRR